MPGRTIERLNVQLTAEDQRLQAGLRRSEARIRRARQRISQDLQTISNRGALAFGALGAASTAAVVAVGNQAVEIDALSRSIGTTAEEYQVLLAAFENTGLDATAVTAVITRLNEVIAEARDGSIPLRASLDQLGLSFQDLENLSSTDALGLVIDRMNTLTSESDRARIGLELFQNDFERGGVVFTEGSEGLARFRRELERNGGLISQNTIDRIANFSTALGTASRIARAQFLEGFIDQAPRFERFTNNITDLAQEARSLGEILGRVVDTLVDYRGLVLGVGGAFGALTIGRPFVQLITGTLANIERLRTEIARNTAAQREANQNDNERRRSGTGSGAQGILTPFFAALGGALSGNLGRIFNFVGRQVTRVFDTQPMGRRTLDLSPGISNERIDPRGGTPSPFARSPIRQFLFRFIDPFGTPVGAGFTRGHGFRNSIPLAIELYRETIQRALNNNLRVTLRDRINVFREHLGRRNLNRVRFPGGIFPTAPVAVPPTSSESRSFFRRRPMRQRFRPDIFFTEPFFSRTERPFANRSGPGGRFVRPARERVIPFFAISVTRATTALGLFAAAVRTHGQNLDNTGASLVRFDNAVRDAAANLPGFISGVLSRLNTFLSIPRAPGRGLPNPVPENQVPRRGAPTTRRQNERILDELFFRIRGRRFLQNESAIENDTIRDAVRQGIGEGFNNAVRVGAFDERIGPGGNIIGELFNESFENNFGVFRRESLPINPTQDVLDPFGRSIETALTAINRQTTERLNALFPILTPRAQPDEDDFVGPIITQFQRLQYFERRQSEIDDYEVRILRAQRDRQREIDREYATRLDEIDDYERRITQLQQDRARQRREDFAAREAEIDRYERDILAQQRELGDEQALRLYNQRFENLGVIGRAVETTGINNNFYETFAQRFGNNMQQAFLNLDLSGSFSDFADSVLRSIANSFRESLADQIGAFFGNLIQDIFSRRGRGGTNAGNGFFATILSLPFSGGRASSPRTGAGGIINLGPEFQRPRFQSGGFVPGIPGTEVPIRAHAGELVLNQTQQAALFRAANGSGEFGSSNVYNFNAEFRGDTTQQTLDDVRREAIEVARITQAEFVERGFINGGI